MILVAYLGGLVLLVLFCLFFPPLLALPFLLLLLPRRCFAPAVDVLLLLPVPLLLPNP